MFAICFWFIVELLLFVNPLRSNFEELLYFLNRFAQISKNCFCYLNRFAPISKICLLSRFAPVFLNLYMFKVASTKQLMKKYGLTWSQAKLYFRASVHTAGSTSPTSFNHRGHKFSYIDVRIKTFCFASGLDTESKYVNFKILICYMFSQTT